MGNPDHKNGSAITAVRRLHFCAGHRVLGHEGKCAHLHGHNYIVFAHSAVLDDALDEVGRVVDFGVLKHTLGGWIDENWDHGFIYFKRDQQLVNLYAGPLKEMKHYEADWNPTAENMARHLLKVGNELLDDPRVSLTKVDVWETENCLASAE